MDLFRLAENLMDLGTLTGGKAGEREKRRHVLSVQSVKS
jgi:hypothetical protein